MTLAQGQNGQQQTYIEVDFTSFREVTICLILEAIYFKNSKNNNTCKIIFWYDPFTDDL